ncbi:hypothetical protein [Arthrobacter psychrochitiniphilus]|uniref:Uncharacterized protein n=1 Tax=Arthrobacter psychrochitiniphilus TaxID=291045 RepID=A0A2V3DW53_9MICC|nr:hypothetical protein [Arthrobacter psychrochitiniphilus]NYG16313.1 hypothetical protein [Arthrobacter psychrochitiniphilus]PXA69519.1 hypothetical protein CVS29_02970 [Arthrobacter psychrochitiniphilus]
MTAGNESPISAVDSMNLGLPFWLPPFGRGNGRQALYWAALADLPERMVDPALAALGAEDIPAWASPVHSGPIHSVPANSGPSHPEPSHPEPSHPEPRHHRCGHYGASHHHEPEPGEAPYRLWVATMRYERAEDIMLRVLNDGR